MIQPAGESVPGTGRLEREDHVEVFLTRTGTDPQAVYTSIVEELGAEGIEPLRETAYGLRGRKDEVREIRKAAYRFGGLDASLPAGWIEGVPADGADFAGVQLWGVIPKGDAHRISSIPCGSRTARCWEGPDFRMFHLSALTGEEGADSEAQAAKMFEKALSVLQTNGMEYRQVVRTWIYLSRILDWYDGLNRVRTAHHKKVGLGAELERSVYPASTGIQGRAGGEECVMDMLAVDPGKAMEVRPLLRSSRQEQAFSYGSGFSRGMVLAMGGRKVVHVSGTASIDASGATVFVGDNLKQCEETLLNVEALLKGEGGGLDSIVQSTLFCKTSAGYEAWGKMMAQVGAPAFPRVDLFADVCRDDLLVELEAVAVI